MGGIGEGGTRNEAQRRFSEAIGPCPNCGAPAVVDAIEGTFSWSMTSSPDFYLAGLARCSARCDEREPGKYLAAVNARGA